MSRPRDGSAPKPRYYVRLTGHGRQRWLTDPRTGQAFTRKADAERHLTETLQAMHTGTWAAPSPITVDDHADRWLLLARGRLKPSTWASYRSVLRKRLSPALGHVRLQQLTPAMLDDLYTRMLAAGLSTRTVHYTHTIIKALLSDAVRKGLLTNNPATGATPPTTTPGASHSTWTAQQLAILLHSSQEHQYGPLWAFLALTGCRRGEALGLRWTDIDHDSRRVMLVHTIGAVEGRTTTGTPKSGHGRSIAADPGLLTRLEAHRRRQAEQRMAAPSWTDTGLVFTRPDGRPVHPDTASRAFKRAAAHAGLPEIRLHDLRHTWATIALQAGINPKVVQERLGHSSVTITLGVYSHVLPSLHDAAAELIADTISAHTPRRLAILET